MKAVAKLVNHSNLITPDVLGVGEMMVVIDDDSGCNGDVFLRVYNLIINLNEPGSTWNPKGCLITGRKLLPGESITLIQE